MKSVFLSCLTTAASISSALASADNQYSLPFSIEQGNCPVAVNVGVHGESFATGVRYTIDIKNFLDFGSKLQIDGQDRAVTFSAPTRFDLSDCVARSEFRIWPGATVRVDFQFGMVEVVLFNQSPSLTINTLSTFNNQAIFSVSERL